MEQYQVKKIGEIRSAGDEMWLELESEYRPALEGLDGFGYIQVLWWFSGCDNKADRSHLQEQSPYKGAPAVLGTFATRSPMRPNPVALSCAGVTYIDQDWGVIGLTYIDAEDRSPVLDIKPYTPSLDRVKNPAVPGWCGHWPDSLEGSACFDWGVEFNFYSALPNGSA